MAGTSYQPLSQSEDVGGSYQEVPRKDVTPTADDILLVRPPVYYNDGPFSPPSSVDESQEHLLDKDRDEFSSAERGHQDHQESKDSHSRLGRVCDFGNKRQTRFVALCLMSLLGLAVVVGIFAGFSSGNSYRTRGSKHITMDHVFNGTFGVERKSLNWVPEAGDGVFSINDNGVIKLIDLNTNTTTELLKYSDVRDTSGRILAWNEWKLSPDMNYVLVKTDYKKQWRWSSFGNYYVHKLSDHTTHPVAPPTNPSSISYATWSPIGESIAFVSKNDLYVLPSADPSAVPIRVTSEGNSSLFFGVPDWVYEEEVFSKPSALWWSPDARRIAFLRSDETKVNDYTFPIYNPTENSFTVTPYTDFVTMKYPKPGFPNPLVTVHVFDLNAYQTQNTVPVGAPAAFIQELTWNGRRSLEDSIIQEIAWVANTTLLVKEISRSADDGSVVICNLAEQQTGLLASGTIVRQLGVHGEEGDKGWIDASQNVYRLPESLGLGEGAYLDMLPTKEGFNQIALFNPAGSTTPQWLTSGQSEVTAPLSVDVQRRVVYFLAAGEDGIGRKLLSVPIPVDSADHQLVSPTALSWDDIPTPSHYDASFSPQAGFYLLSYEGPNIPWQRLIKVDDSNYSYVLTNNSRLNQTISEYRSPSLVYSTMDSDGYVLNTLEIRPPDMDGSGRIKYPVLFRVYGGPGSQTVETKFRRDWDYYLACSLNYIVVTVDGRGTGSKGRQLRNPVKGNLGYWETRDQINAAKFWASKDYVDTKRIGIWGWSYGGFMAAKVVEADAGVHTLAMSVAPVTSWLLYDTIYTERYMGLPVSNALGYMNASISDVRGFNHVDYLLAHGSGDDNVHFANTAHLLDMFTQGRIRGFRFRMFTDSDHSIQKRGANREVFEFMASFLIEKWGKGGQRKD
ncbi:dipeptidyl aminopeptidase [Gautieria morchelliformis]|nr:dipeptidyl aminopeptidase [Gautieria morchelliformis]